MTDPTTVNVALAIPLRGSDVGTWDTPVNNDFTAIDGFLGGVQTISAGSSPIVLTAPAGFTPTPSGGPTQAQNAVLQFSGTLTAPVQVTLPLPGFYIVENLTTGAFVLSFRAIGAGAVIGVDQGETLHLYNDGTNVKFVNLGRIGHTEIWAGLSAMPAWVAACTNPPYLLCDGTVYNVSSYPYLGGRIGSAFGGNGITTFGVPDLRGRNPLIYDGTGARITVAKCGLNGQILGGSLDTQTLTLAQLPTGITSNNAAQSITVSAGGASIPTTVGSWNPTSANSGSIVNIAVGSGGVGNTTSMTGNNPIAVTSNNTGGASQPIIPPTQVTGIAVIRAA